MKDKADKFTKDMYDDNEYGHSCAATEDRLDQQVKEYLWNNRTKTFEPYTSPVALSYEEWYEQLEDANTC